MSTTDQTPLVEELLEPSSDTDQPDEAGMYDAEEWGQVENDSKRQIAWKRIIVWTLIVALGGSVLVTLGIQLSSGGSPNANSAAVVDPATDMQSQAWQGAAFPISTEHGPATFNDTRAMGFAQTAKGAALAALHIASRISPYNGPAVFQPTITEQVTGDTSALLTLMEGEYNKVAKENNLTDGAPLIRPTGEMLAWRIEGGFDPKENNVQLYVKTPRATEVIYTVPMVWSDGDWKIQRPTDDAGLTFGVDEYDNSIDFEAFIPTSN